ncbi:MAG: carboxypeptidase-like regulatory domain-containing protein, partial [bacterium]|nr:carboxypeptidase-like regulatory domain-containing protein [bacterium]
IPNPRYKDTYPAIWGTVANPSGAPTVSVTVPEDGVYMFKISVYDNAGNPAAGNYVSRCIQIDTQPPAAPTISSPTHPDSNKPSMANNVTFRWTDSPDTSGIAGYSYVMDNSPATIPDEVVNFNWESISISNYSLSNGTWYFHLRARDNAGNWSPASHYQVQINKGLADYSQWLKVNDASVFTLSCERGASYTLTCNSAIPGGRVHFYSYYDMGMIGVLDSADEIVSSFFIDDNSHVDEDAASSTIQITRLVPEGYTGTLTIHAVDETTNSAAFCTLGFSQRVLPQFISGRVLRIIGQKVNGVINAEGIESNEWALTPIDSNGEYKLYLPPGKYDVYVEIAGIPSDSNKNKEIMLTANNPISNVDFEIVTTIGLSSITGRVMDDTGKGVPGANVADRSISPTVWAYTDMDGYYVIYVKQGEEYYIQVDAFGYTDQNKSQIAAGSKNVDFTLPLCKATISGAVTDANGNGVLGAEVMDVDTNRFGHYCLYVPEGSINYSVYAQGIDSPVSRKTANAGDTDVNFQLLYHNSTISGKVYEPDGITPLVGACVWGSYWPSTGTVSDYASSYTNSDGSYELKVLEGCNYSVSAEKHGYYNLSYKEEVPAPNTAINFIMPGKKPGIITGVVRDTMGIPTSGALIEVMKDNIPIATATATSNGSGSYTIMDLPEGTYALCMSRGGYESAVATVIVKAGETGSNDFMVDKTNLFYVDDDVKQYENGSTKYPYRSIQQAVSDCCLSAGGTVSVATGIYNESVHINKEIALIGAGADQTTITASGLDSTNTVTFDETAGKAIISGFKITGATGSFFVGGSGIYCDSSSSSPLLTI